MCCLFIHAFLEISTHLFLPYLSNLRIRNEFTDPCFSMFVYIICLREMTIHYWAKFASLFGRKSLTFVVQFSSFTARDCNACFSQIFEKRTFSYLNEEEESLFMTLYRTLDSLCSSYSNFVTLSSSILLTVVTEYGLNQSGLDNNIWPLFVTEMHTNLGRLNCTNCNTQTSIKCLKR